MTRKTKIKSTLRVIIIIICILFMVIATNNFKVTRFSTEYDSDPFYSNIKFSTKKDTTSYLEFNGKKDEENAPFISVDGKTITFKTPMFNEVGDKAIIHYWIINENSENAKIGKIVCRKKIIDLAENDGLKLPVNENTESTDDDYIQITTKNEFHNKILKGGETTKNSGTIEIELVKPYTNSSKNLTYKITCQSVTSKVK